MMKIKVIGSGSMWTKYNSASYMIDNNILIDIPNGTCKNLYRMGINPLTIENVMITHFHGDHYFDIPFYFLIKSKHNSLTVNMYCSKEGKRKNNSLLKLAFPNSAKDVLECLNINYCFKDKFQINDYQVQRYLVEHGRMKPAYGYIFTNDDKKIGFTGDCAICENVEYMASICDYLFCDCMFVVGTEKHMGIDKISALANKYVNCKFVVSHLEDVTREELKKVKIPNIIVPEDGELFEV